MRVTIQEENPPDNKNEELSQLAIGRLNFGNQEETAIGQANRKNGRAIKLFIR